MSSRQQQQPQPQPQPGQAVQDLANALQQALSSLQPAAAAGASVRAREPPPFEGRPDDNAAEWIEILLAYKQATKATDAVMADLLPTLLSPGSAAWRWWRRQTPAVRGDFNQVIAALRAEFSDPNRDRAVLDQLQAARQRPGEPVRVYEERVLALAAQLTTYPADQQLREYLLAGYQQAVRAELLISENITDVQRLRARAAAIEYARAPAATTNAVSASQAHGPSLRDELDSLRQQLEELRLEVRRLKQRRPKTTDRKWCALHKTDTHSDDECRAQSKSTNLILARRSPRVKVHFKGQSVNALVDSGSDVCIVSSRVATPDEATAGNLAGAGRSRLDVVGCVSAAVRVGDDTGEALVRFWVVRDFEHDLLLGSDYLSMAGAVVDYGRGEMRLASGTAAPFLSETASAARTTRVAPGTGRVMLVTARVPDGDYLLEPATDRLSLARALVTVKDGLTATHAINTSAAADVAFKGTPVALLTPAQHVNTIEELTGESAEDSLPHTDRLSFDESSGGAADLASLDLSHLGAADAGRVRGVVQRYASVFATDPSAPAQAELAPHRIETGAAPPTHVQPYRANPHRRALIEEAVAAQLRAGVIEPAQSPWSAPVVLAAKRDGTLRFCVDYRRLNAVTTPDVFPMPRADDTLALLDGSAVYTTLDAAAGYWQIPVAPEDRPKTAFTTPSGQYQYRRLPFGLRNAPATFQRAMQLLLGGVLWRHVLVYIDDVVIFSRTLDEHLVHLADVLERLRRARVSLKLSKCRFAVAEVEYLGHLVSANGIRPAARHVDAVRQLTPPRDAGELRVFLGLAGYYRRFIKGFSLVAQPLHDLLKDGVAFTWSQQHRDAWTHLRDALLAEPVLAHPRFDQPFRLSTDASANGLGAVLSQQQPDGSERPVAYASRALRGAERRYAAVELELLGLVFAVVHFRYYLNGSRFVVLTDHAALQYMRERTATNARLLRWSLLLAEFDFEVQYRPGSKMAHVDALSRLHHINAVTQLAGVVDLDALRAAQAADAVATAVLDQETTAASEAGAGWVLDSDNLVRFRARAGDLARLYVPPPLRAPVLSAAHGQHGNSGVAKTYARLHRTLYWPGMLADVQRHVATCDACQRLRVRDATRPTPLQPLSASQFNELVALDIVGPLEGDTSYRYVLSCVDYCTRFAVAAPLTNQQASTVAQAFVDRWVLVFGRPLRILTDQGANFTGELFTDVAGLIGSRRSTTTPYHPSSNGLVERFNATMVAGLRHALLSPASPSSSSWAQALPAVVWAYNSTPQSTTRWAPYELVFGLPPPSNLDPSFATERLPQLPLSDYRRALVDRLAQVRADAATNQLLAQRRQRDEHDRRRRAQQPPAVAPGALLLLRRRGPDKLAPAWIGPLRVVGHITPAVVLLRHGRRTVAVNINHTKPYHTPDGPPPFAGRTVPPRGTDELLEQQPDNIALPSARIYPRPRDATTPDEPTSSAGGQADRSSSQTATAQAAPQHPPAAQSSTATSAPGDLDDEYPVEEVVDAVQTDDGVYYRVRWHGYPPSADTWEPADHLRHATDLLAEFQRAWGDRPFQHAQLSVRGERARANAASPTLPRAESHEHQVPTAQQSTRTRVVRAPVRIDL